MSSPATPGLTHTQSDQPISMIHPAPMTFVLIVCASSPSTEGCRYVASSGRSPDHVHDLVVDFVSLCLARMVFLRLFEFFADFYNRHRCDHYAKLAGLWASARLLYLYASSCTT